MDLLEAKEFLNKNGFILEDTETDDDEYDALTDEMEKDPTWWKNDISKSLRTKLNKRSKLYNKHANLEDKENAAINYNLKNFYRELNVLLSKKGFHSGSSYYDDNINCQSVEYENYPKNEKEYTQIEVIYYPDKDLVQVVLSGYYGPYERLKIHITDTIEKAVKETYNEIMKTLREYN